MDEIDQKKTTKKFLIVINVHPDNYNDILSFKKFPKIVFILLKFNI